MDIRPQGRWKATDKQMKAKWQSHQSDFKAKVEVEELAGEVGGGDDVGISGASDAGQPVEASDRWSAA